MESPDREPEPEIMQEGDKEGLAKRIPFVAGLLSFLMPGLGQLYNGRLKKALLFYAIMLLFQQTFFMIVYGLSALLYIYALGIAFKVIAVGDAYIDARKVGCIRPGLWQRWYIHLLIIIITILIIPVYGNATVLKHVRTFYCPSTSMMPTLQLGDYFVVDKRYYKNHIPARGDLIILNPPESADAGGKLFIKRVIATGGESVQINNGKVFINDCPLKEPYIAEPVRYDMEKIIVGKGKVFVLGDNRNNSEDSHIWGPLDISRVKGKSLYIFWPPVRAGTRL
ncbi:MAG: signal peptidase I [Vulcanimicrobiota bacterium]